MFAGDGRYMGLGVNTTEEGKCLKSQMRGWSRLLTSRSHNLKLAGIVR